MRKILLATTALVGVALTGAAMAAPTSPISLNVGGYTDFVAGFYHTSNILGSSASGPGSTTVSNGSTSRDFETEFKLNFDAMGKASNGVEYGANVGLWNGPEVTNLWTGGNNQVTVNSAYVWMSGAFGKALFGDEHGASDLFVYAPTVGEGQIDGRYQDFTSPFLLARWSPSGIDNTEHSTKITYYTPKVGNENNKVQLGVSYTPNMYDYGQNVVKTTSLVSPTSNANIGNGPTSPYQDVIEGAAAYTGNFHPVTLALSGQIITGAAGANGTNTPAMFFNAPSANFQDFTSWGLGTQVGFNGFTLGGSYVDEGRYGTVHGQNKAQEVWSFGGKYEFDKVGVAVNYLTGEGYDNMLLANGTVPGGVNTTNYVSQFNAYGAGATYTWFPGLTSAVDGVMFSQDARDELNHNDGYVVLVSQKLTF